MFVNKSTCSCENTYQPGVPDYKQKVGGACKNLTRMYECRIRSRGDTLDCKDKAQCLEIMVGFLKLGSGLELETKAIRRFAKISQSRRRLALSHLRHCAKQTLTTR